MSWLDSLVAETIADRIFAGATGVGDDDAEDAAPAPPHRYFARKALNAAESEAKLVEALYDRCAGRTLVEDNPTVAAGLQRLAQTAWIHYGHARAAAAGAEGDPFLGPLAHGAVGRAHRAALAIRRAAARAVTRAAIRARQAARTGSSAPSSRHLVRRLAGRSPRLRAPARRRVRAAAVASAGSGGEGPGPAPSRSPRAACHSVGRPS
jgi:hypothetical protein